METIVSLTNHTTITTITPDSGFESAAQALISSIPSLEQLDQPPLQSSSPISTVESTFSSGSSPPVRRLSTSTSISAASFHSCISEEAKFGKSKKFYIRDSCLRCTTLGLRCSLPRELVWKEGYRSTIFCKRCEKSGERFCIARDTDDGKYFADGADEVQVKKRVEELFEPKRESWKWCLPKIPPGTRVGLRRVWLRKS